MPPADGDAPLAEAGFTLLEVIIVLVILGLVGGLVMSRGPARSPTLSMAQATGEVAGAFRLARTRAIASSRVVPVRFGADGSTIQLGADPPRLLPDRIRAIRGVSVMDFRPDGSASGGMVELTAGTVTRTVEVNWLTGRVVVR